MGIHDKQRVVFEVIQKINPQSGEGVIRDKAKYQFIIGLHSLNPDCDGKVFVGEQLEGLVDGQRIYDLAPYLSSSHERDRVKSAGPVGEEVGWTPRSGDSRYSPALPYDSRCSGPLDPRIKREQKDMGVAVDTSQTRSLSDVPGPKLDGPESRFQKRLIPKTAVPDKNDLSEYISASTGHTVSMIGVAIDRDIYWECEVYSLDGRPNHEGATGWNPGRG